MFMLRKHSFYNITNIIKLYTGLHGLKGHKHVLFGWRVYFYEWFGLFQLCKLTFLILFEMNKDFAELC